MQANNYSYSFGDVTGQIIGPSGSAMLTNTGIANEGITIEPDERTSTQRGADGSWMHTLIQAQGGRIIVRALKNGIINARLSQMFNGDTISSANTGKNTISIRNPMTGDWWEGVGCAFVKKPTVVYDVAGPMNEWTFSVGALNGALGFGVPAIE